MGALRERWIKLNTRIANAGAMTSYLLSAWLNSGDITICFHVRFAIQRYVALKYTIAWIRRVKRSHATYEDGWLHGVMKPILHKGNVLLRCRSGRYISIIGLWEPSLHMRYDRKGVYTTGLHAIVALHNATDSWSNTNLETRYVLQLLNTRSQGTSWGAKLFGGDDLLLLSRYARKCRL